MLQCNNLLVCVIRLLISIALENEYQSYFLCIYSTDLFQKVLNSILRNNLLIDYKFIHLSMVCDKLLVEIVFYAFDQRAVVKR